MNFNGKTGGMTLGMDVAGLTQQAKNNSKISDFCDNSLVKA